MAIEVIQVTEENITVTLTDVGIRGRAGLVFRGDYNDTVQYYQGDAVRFSNNLYIATGTPEVGTDPTDSAGTENTGWELLVFGSPDQTAIVDFHIQTASGVIVFAEGDLIKDETGKYYWALASGTLEGSGSATPTDLTDTANFEERGYQPTVIATGLLSARPTSGINAGDMYVSSDDSTYIWSGSAWLEVTINTVTATREGLMPAADFNKLADIESQSDKNDKVDVAFSGSTITVTSSEDRSRVTDTASIPDASDTVKGLATVDTDTLSVVGGEISADGTIELGQLQDVTAPTTTESGNVLRGLNDGTTVSYEWASNEAHTETIQLWDTTGVTNYTTETSTIGSSIVEHDKKLYVATSDIDYETKGSCSISGITNRTQCTNATNNGTWTITDITADSDWDLIGPGALELLSDVNVTAPELEWNLDSPILARHNNEWRLFPGLDKLTNLGDIPTPLTSQAGYVLRTDGATVPTYSWINQVARIQDFSSSDDYISGDLVRSEDKLWLAVSTNTITASTTLPTDGTEWQAVGPETIRELNDTEIDSSTLGTGDILTFSSGAWRNLTANDAVAAAIDFVSIGDIPGNSVADQVLVSLGTIDADDHRYEWKTYGRDVKNVQAYSSSQSYEGSDLVQEQGRVFISLNTTSATAGSPLDGSGNATNTSVWNEIGTSDLGDVRDVDLVAIETAWTTDTVVLGFNVTTQKWQRFAGLDTLENIGDVNLTITEQNWSSDTYLLGYNSTDNEWQKYPGLDTFTNIGDIPTPPSGTRYLEHTSSGFSWTDTVGAAAKVAQFNARNAYSTGSLVEFTSGTHATIYLNIVALSAPATGAADHATPNLDSTHWEIIGPESFSQLEDVIFTSLVDKHTVQYNGTNWVNVTTNSILDDGNLASIGDVNTPTSTTDNNKVLQVVFSGTTPTYSWVDRTTNTSTIQAWDSNEDYIAGEIVSNAGTIWIAKRTVGKSSTIPAEGDNWDKIGPESIADLNDTVIGTTADGQVLSHNGTNWVNASLSSETEAHVDLFDLKDVDGTPAALNVLRRNSAGTGWEPITPASFAASFNLENVGNVADTVADTSLLQKSGSNYVAKTPAAIATSGIDVADLKDTTLSSVAANDILQRDSASKWVNKTPNALAETMDLASLKQVANPIKTTDDEKALQVAFSGSDTFPTYSWVDVRRDVKTFQSYTNADAYIVGDIVREGNGLFVCILANSSTTVPAVNTTRDPGVASSIYWNKIGPETVRDLDDVKLTGGSDSDVPADSILKWNATDSKWEDVALSAHIEATTSLHDLSDVDESGLANDDLLRYNLSTKKWDSIDPAVVTEKSVKLDNLNDITAPTAAENDFVLQGKHATDGTISYDWVHASDNASSIQIYSASNTYAVGDMVRYRASSTDSFELYLAEKASNSGAPVTPGDNASWDLIGPEKLDQLKDVSLSGVASRNLLSRNAANTGWDNILPAVMSKISIRLRDLKTVPSDVTLSSGILQRPTGAGNDWVIRTPADIASDSTNTNSGVKVENLRDVSSTVAGTNQVLQYDGSIYRPVDVDNILDDGTIEGLSNVNDTTGTATQVLQKNSAGTEYVPVSVDTLLNTGELESLSNVVSSVNLNPSSVGNDLGKVLTVRSTGAGTTASPLKSSFVFEPNTSANVPGFNTGSSTNPQTYSSGDLVNHNAQIWIALTGINSADTAENNSLTSPPGRTLTGGGLQWELVGPETIKELNDTIITSEVDKNVLQYDGTNWKNQTPATVAGDTILTNVGDVESATASDNDFLKRVSGEWKHQATLGNLDTVMDDVKLDSNIAEHNILSRDSSGDWVNVKLEDHIENNVDIPLNHLSDVNTSGETAGQVLEFTSGGWVPKSRGFDDITPADETGNTVTLNRFDGRAIRSIETNSGIQTITFATEALTSADMTLTPQSFEWDVVTPSMSTKVDAANDILFQDIFLNTVDSIDMVTGGSTQNLLSSVHTETSTFLQNWSETFTLAPTDPRTGGFPTAGETSVVTATLTDQNSANAKTATKQLNWLEPTLGASTSSVSSSFLEELRTSHDLIATVGNTSDPVSNTSLVSLTVDGQDRTTTTGTNSPTASNSTYNRSVQITLYKQSVDGASAVNTDSINGVFNVRFTKPGTTPAQTEEITRTSIVNYTATFPVFTGFLDQGTDVTVTEARLFNSVGVNDDGTGFRRSYSITNNTGKDQTLWFGIRKVSVSGSTLTFAAHNPGANPLVISNITDGGDKLLTAADAGTLPGYVGETYTFYGIPLVSAGESIIVTIS